jgi:CDP-diacylglycerol--serine O-phosphatidyltransferase
MVSHVHYPNFKGDGAEKIYTISKICAAVMFGAIVFFTLSVAGVVTAIFSTYAVFGIVNSLIALLNREV